MGKVKLSFPFFFRNMEKTMTGEISPMKKKENRKNQMSHSIETFIEIPMEKTRQKWRKGWRFRFL